MLVLSISHIFNSHLYSLTYMYCFLVCRMNWGPPKYVFRYGWLSGMSCWSGSVILQAVRLPYYCDGTRLDLGPFECPTVLFTQMDVVVKCSEMALEYLNVCCFNLFPIHSCSFSVPFMTLVLMIIQYSFLIIYCKSSLLMLVHLCQFAPNLCF